MLQELIQDAEIDTAGRADFRNGVLEYWHADPTSVRTDAESSQYYSRKARQEIIAALATISDSSCLPDEFSLEENEIDALFGVLNQLAASGRVREAIQKVFVTMNSWLCGGRFDLCRKALEQADPIQLGPDLALSFLTITFAAKQHLNPHRAELLRDLRELIEKSSGVRVAQAVLRNLQ
jgi:hypothetical protein